MARMELQCSGPRWDLTEGPLDNEEVWRYRAKKSWESNGDNFKPETVEKALDMLESAIAEPHHSPFNTTHGVWRLVYWRRGIPVTVTLSGGRTIDIDRRIVSGPFRQGADAGQVDREAARRRIFPTEQEVPEEPSLPTLDETPVPTGTVVEVLDEWGLPTGSTEVT